MFDDLRAADAESSINELSSQEKQQIPFTPPGGAATAQREEYSMADKAMIRCASLAWRPKTTETARKKTLDFHNT